MIDSNYAPSVTPSDRARYDELLALAVSFARDGDTAALEPMLSAGIPVDLRNAKGHTLLMLAAYHGHAETVEMLLRRGAAPDARNDRGQTPIGGAAFKGHDDVVRALLRGGADAGADQGFGLTPVMYATMFGRFATASILRSHLKSLKSAA